MPTLNCVRHLLSRWLFALLALLVGPPTCLHAQMPRAAFLPGTGVNITRPSGSFIPRSIAVDRVGNLYVLDSFEGAVYRLTPNGASWTEMVVGGNLKWSRALAVTPDGTVYVTTHSNNGARSHCVFKYTLKADASGYTETLLADATVFAFNEVNSMTVDAAGNLYFGEGSVGTRLIKATLQADQSYTYAVLRSGFGWCGGVAVDDQGNVFYSEAGANSLWKATPQGAGYTFTRIGTWGGANVCGLAFGPGGHLYAKLGMSNYTLTLFLPSGASYLQVPLQGDMGSASSLGIDGSGCFYASRDGGGAIQKLDLSRTPSLTFPNTLVGATSASQTVSVVNLGDAPLELSVPASGTNPTLTGDFLLSAGGTCPSIPVGGTAATLATGARWTLNPAFKPTAGGSRTGALTLDLNHLGAPSTHVINLNGTGEPVAVLPASLPGGQVAQAYSQQITAAGAAGPYTFFVSSGSLPPGLTLTTDGALTGTPTAAGSFSFVVKGASAGGEEGATSYTVGIAKGVATVTQQTFSASYTGKRPTPQWSTVPPGLGLSPGFASMSGEMIVPGVYDVFASVVDPNWKGSANGSFTITKAPLVVKAQDQTRPFGAANPPLSYTMTGFVNGETQATATSGQPGLSTTADAASPRGDYPITASIGSLTAANYSFSFLPGTLHVTKGAATVTLDAASLSRTYTGSAQAVTATTVPDGIPVTFTYNGSATAPTNAGTYSVVASAENDTLFGTVTGTLVIAKANASITLGSLNPTYTGAPLAATATTVPANLKVDFTYAGSATVPMAVNSYAVVGTINDTNHQGTASGTLRVAPAPLTVKADDLSRVHGMANPTLTYTLVGLRGTDTPATAVTGVPVLSTSADVASAVGAYPIVLTVGTLTSTNYTLAPADGTLTVIKAPATVTLGALSHTYSGAPLAATASTTPDGLLVQITYNGSATAPTAAGSYAVVATIHHDRYQGTATGTLVIAKAKATITLGNLVQTYAGVPLGISATTQPAGLKVEFAYEGNPAMPAAAGLYKVLATVRDANYEGVLGGGFQIQPALLTVTAEDARKEVGRPNPVLTYVITGFRGADTLAKATQGVPVLSTSATEASPVGTYPIQVQQGTLTAANYALAFVNGTLTVSKGTVSILLGGLRQAYTGTPRVVTATTVPAGLTVKITYDGSPTAPTAAGEYGVEARIEDSSYRGRVSGTLTIEKAVATVNLGGLAQTYDGSPRVVTVSTTPADLKVLVTYGGGAAPTGAGAYAVSAVVQDPNHVGVASGTLQVAKAPVEVVLEAPSQWHAGQSVDLVARVRAPGVLSGAVDFLADDLRMGSASLDGGRAKYGCSSLTQGSHALRAVFKGDANLLEGRSDLTPTKVLPPAVSLTPTAASLSLPSQGSASTTLAVQSLGVLTAPVTLSATGLPNGLQAVFSTTTLAPGSLPATVDVRFTPGGSLLARVEATSFSGGSLFLACGILALPLASRRRRKLLLVSAATLLLAVGFVACGGGSKSGVPSTPAVASGTYVVTLSATSGTTVIGTTTVTLNVL